ncbi:PfkB family carbohydrate kinase [Cellulomonas denverensis]|nr:PfkB family carbohydrate kinase [Cellulomonas denverensis]
MLLCCGLVTLDVTQVVEAVPRPDQKVVADHLDVTFGGPAANAAATAVALGVPARLVTAIGTGPVADLIRSGLRESGVEVVDLAAGSDAHPPVSTVLVTRATGQRAVASVNAIGMPVLGGPGPEVVDGVTAVLVDGHHLGAALPVAAEARRRGIPVALDGGSWKPGLGELLGQVDHAVLSADFALPDPGGLDAAASGEVPDLLARLLAGWPLRSVARSAGAGPVELRERGGAPVLLPVEPVTEVVDTLGAGDVLHGALAAELARGSGIEAALRAGIAVASRSVRYAGARGWIGR